MRISIHLTETLEVEGNQNIVVRIAHIVIFIIQQTATIFISKSRARNGIVILEARCATISCLLLATCHLILRTDCGIHSPLADIDSHLEENRIEADGAAISESSRDALIEITLIDAYLQTVLRRRPNSRRDQIDPTQIRGMRNIHSALLCRRRRRSVRNKHHGNHTEKGNSDAGIFDHPQLLSGRAQKSFECDEEATSFPYFGPASTISRRCNLCGVAHMG